MPKKQQSSKKQTASFERNVEFFRWKERKNYTAPEEFVLRVLEQQGACADSEIAEILCLAESDVAVLICDMEEAYPGDVQGDSSRRSLCDGFSRDLPNGIAVSFGKQKKPKELFNESGEMSVFLDQFHDCVQTGGKHEQFRRGQKVQRYLLKISFKHDADEPDFRCRDIAVPESACAAMKMLLPEHLRIPPPPK